MAPFVTGPVTAELEVHYKFLKNRVDRTSTSYTENYNEKIRPRN